MRSTIALAFLLIPAAAAAAPVVILGPPQVVVVPAPTVSVATRVSCRAPTAEDFAPDVRTVAGVTVMAPQRGAFAVGRCTTETTTTVTRPIR